MIPIGISLPTFGVRYADLRAAAQLLDTLGYESIWLWDHYVSWNDPRESVLECWTTLAGLASATARIRLGSLVANNTNHHPGRLAKIVATVQELAGGRLELGIGAGGWAAEQRAFGIAQGDRAERTARLAEALAILPALWGGQPVTFRGQYYQLENAVVVPAPVPRPRVIVGGRSAELARLAAQHADGLNLQWRFRDSFPAILAVVESALAEAGRSRTAFELSVLDDWPAFAADPAAALARWQAFGFDRAILAAPVPFPLAQFEQLARQLPSIARAEKGA
jgi:alkanesulfonate monooxygenase SsuD/methylene tetrahydromethanopterin reductase-like flavin-dependent oxidoreductase (luciferase family)